MSEKEKKLAAVEAEIAAERAAALSRSEVRLRQAVEALRRFDAGVSKARSREILLKDASDACLGYVVHRETMGLTRENIQQLRRECGVPDEVWNQMGVV
jgi:hypothetical protein